MIAVLAVVLVAVVFLIFDDITSGAADVSKDLSGGNGGIGDGISVSEAVEVNINIMPFFPMCLPHHANHPEERQWVVVI